MHLVDLTCLSSSSTTYSLDDDHVRYSVVTDVNTPRALFPQWVYNIGSRAVYNGDQHTAFGPLQHRVRKLPLCCVVESATI